MTRTVEQDFSALTGGAGKLTSAIGRAFDALGPVGRRVALTGFGAVMALSCGAAAAIAVRLPAEVKAAGDAPEQAVVRSELPSEAAARRYALENPPSYTVASTPDADAPLATDAAPDVQTAEAPTVTHAVYASDDGSADASAPAQTPVAKASDPDT
jgi:hypothetical protein